jgi:hypothetical protein
VGRHQGHDDLGRAQAVDDFVLPVVPGADLARVAPDLDARGGQVDAQPVGQRSRIAPALAEKDFCQGAQLQKSNAQQQP